MRCALIALLSICGQLHAHQVASFQGGDGGWQLGAITLGNLDADADLEIVFPYRNGLGLWFMDAFNANGSRVQGFPYAGGIEPINAAATLKDLNGDGRDDLIFTHGSRIVALNGSNGSVLWSSQMSPATYTPHGGYQAVTNGFYMSSTGLQQPRLPLTAQFFAEVSPPLVIDSNRDGQLEVITPWKIDPDTLSDNQDYNPFVNDLYGFWGEWGIVGEVWSGAVTFHSAATGANLYNYHLHQLVEAGLGVGQADSDNPWEVYVLTDSDSLVAFDQTKPHGFLGKGMLHKQFGKDQRFLSGSYLKGVDVNTADLDGDGKAEVLVPTTQWDPLWQSHETILDDDGAVLWREWKQPVPLQNSLGWLENATMIPVNPNNDNRPDVLSYTHAPEIHFRYWNGVSLESHLGWPKTFWPFYPTHPVVEDVDGDGEEEIIIGTYRPNSASATGYLYVFSLDGTEEHAEPVLSGIKHSPALGDINGDGTIEVVFRSMSGRVIALNFGSVPNAQVSWAMSRGNKGHDANYNRPLFPAGTPIITSKSSNYKSVSLTWSLDDSPREIRVRRSASPGGNFPVIKTLPADRRSFTDSGLNVGSLYVYEVEAVYTGYSRRSAPTAILSLYSSNLVANSGFEEDDNSHWDKWDTGNISWTNMVTSTNVVYQGRKSMKIELRNKASNSSIKQYNQYGIPDASIAVRSGSLYSFGGFLRSTGLSASSAHSFEWNSSLTANTNPRPLLPWPNYFTPHFSPGTSSTPWTYANRTFRMPFGFPNVELRHRMDASSPLSGDLYLDNVFFRELAPTNHPSWTSLIPFRSTWKYFTNNPPASWFQPSFNDSSWRNGTAKFGAGGGPQNIQTPLPQKLPQYYFRKSFTVPGLDYSDLLVSATCTDDYGGIRYPLRIFLNGTEINSTGIEAVSGQGNEIKYFDLTPFFHLLNLNSTNTIGVILSNTWQTTWDDVAFDLSLMGFINQAVEQEIRFTSVTRSGNNVTLTIASAPNTRLRVESSDQNPLNWQTVQIVTNTTGTITVVDTGQNGRPPPNQAGTRYYRVVQQ